MHSDNVLYWPHLDPPFTLSQDNFLAVVLEGDNTPDITRTQDHTLPPDTTPGHSAVREADADIISTPWMQVEHVEFEDSVEGQQLEREPNVCCYYRLIDFVVVSGVIIVVVLL
ncbi:hypothetical protein Pmani_004937 [Petrolisthes manimaculis]|uniref:Uncharacterized protein n=1 Tax=Petrolisthes manimaculis TaxID=1843537 RepID=A0AAE1QD41_9EUCA|nr:hypothetical protein Pmani_004937 [Petrolisthes manimaculis]